MALDQAKTRCLGVRVRKAGLGFPVPARLGHLVVGPAHEIPPHQQLLLERFPAEQDEAGVRKRVQFKQLAARAEVAQRTRRNVLAVDGNTAVEHQHRMLKLRVKRQRDGAGCS